MSKIVMSISADSPEELFSTILGAAKLISEDVLPAEPDKPVNSTPAPVATPVNGAPQAAPLQKAAPVPIQTSQPPVGQSAPVPTASAASAPAAATVPPVPTSQPPVQPPVAPPPTYTHEQIGKAGADLVASNPDLMPALMDLLKRYGVSMVTELKPEQLGPFATELRGLGAKL